MTCFDVCVNNAVGACFHLRLDIMYQLKPTLEKKSPQCPRRHQLVVIVGDENLSQNSTPSRDN